MGKKSLFKKLDFGEENYEIFEKIIQDLTESGVIEQVKNKIRLKKEESPQTYIRGKISIHPRGFGFVSPEKPAPFKEDVFIPSPYTDNAVGGDIVEVWINPNSNWKKGPEGEVISILQRNKTHLAGIVREILQKEKKAVIQAPTLGPDRPIYIPNPRNRIKVGDRLNIEIKKWTSPIQGKIEHKIGHISDASKDIEAAIAEYGIETSFAKEAIAQADKLGRSVKKADLHKRTDLSRLECITIDPKTARDFDDALSLEKTADGHYHLGVHIADVAHYVPTGSPLDEEAKKRGNSVYFPGRCVPMLPESLSNNLCSLKPNVIRLVMSVFMQLDPDGNLLDYSIKRSYIKSKKRFTYEEAKKVLDKKKKSRYAPLLDLMAELCILLKAKRKERGSVDLALPDIRLEIDKDGNPKGFFVEEYDITHQLVEEFMLKANEIVAMHFTKKGQAAVFRVHAEPSEEDIQDFFSLARVLGFQLPKHPSPEDIQKLFDLAKETPFAHQLAVSFIRSMKLASYSHENVGHYGLALEHYCHFTSPIRRYTDLVIQRLLFGEEKESIDMEEIAKHCSEKERIAFRAESSVSHLKKLRFLHRESISQPDKVYDALIANIKPYGLTFTLLPLEVEGFIHISNLGRDYYHFLSSSQSLKGENTGEIFIVGQLIHVKLLSLNFVSGELEWKLIKSKFRKKRS
ncbi:MAG: ribonuclease R [Simkaniaceae bacterium]